MAYCYSCGCLFNSINLNVRYIIMSYNKNKFEHNLKKAKRQREFERKQKLNDLFGVMAKVQLNSFKK